MNVRAMFRRVALGGVTGVAAFVSGAAVDPAPAGAHCGGHANSCQNQYLVGTWCDTWSQPGGIMWAQYDRYWAECSGTCYNGGTQGCCDSPEACADYPCKPGGCGASCAYIGSYQVPIGGC